MRSAECGMRNDTNAECGMRSAELQGEVMRQYRDSTLPGILRIPHSALRTLLTAALACTSPPSPPCEAVSRDCIAFTIPRGATLKAAVDSLVARDIVRHRGGFMLYARLRGLGSGLKSGIYAFRPGAGWGEIVGALGRGRGTLVRFTVPEGLMLAEIADLAARQLGVSRDSFLLSTEDPVLLRDLGLTAYAANAEGYLYPTTYTLRPHPAARELVRLMANQFAAHWPRRWLARLVPPTAA